MVHSDAIASGFRRAIKRAGVPKIRLHDLRRTHASHLVAAGLELGPDLDWPDAPTPGGLGL